LKDQEEEFEEFLVNPNRQRKLSTMRLSH